jgi:hypothetical protein
MLWEAHLDAHRFDSLTRALGIALGRRRFLALTTGVVVGASTSVDGADAATRCRKGRQTCSRNTQCCSGACQTGRDVPMRDRNRCTCEDGLQQCNNACVDTDTDMRHCGACGNACRAGDHCVEGHCRIHQQCHTDWTGICYMTREGVEHRAVGYLVEENGDDWQPCTRSADCADIHSGCAAPGVNCSCVRAVDDLYGYGDVAPGGICVPLLGSANRTISCEASGGVICAFTAEGVEMRYCEGFVIEVGPCIDYACEGIDMCDGDGVACDCVIATKPPMFPYYTDYFEGPPTCFAYTTTFGLCPA